MERYLRFSTLTLNKGNPISLNKVDVYCKFDTNKLQMLNFVMGSWDYFVIVLFEMYMYMCEI